MTTDLVILGAGGTAREVLSWLDDFNDAAVHYRCLGVLDDDADLHGTRIEGAHVVGSIGDVGNWPTAQFVDALGGPRSFRRRPGAIERTGIPDGRFTSLVHPAAYVSRRSVMGRGCLIFPHATIGAHVSLGRHVVVLPGAVINHDTRIGDFTIVTSGANISGGVTIGATCYIGTGSAVREGISIGDHALIGMGAVVRGDVPPESVAVGQPARVIGTTTDLA
jgi:sugar O-acyltransferase (sialic acid O-acetyltransferase NeuD family)